MNKILKAEDITIHAADGSQTGIYLCKRPCRGNVACLNIKRKPDLQYKRRKLYLFWILLRLLKEFLERKQK
jgi:hypothetical protein